MNKKNAGPSIFGEPFAETDPPRRAVFVQFFPTAKPRECVE